MGAQTQVGKIGIGDGEARLISGRVQPGLTPKAHTRQDKAKLLARKKKDGILHETNKFFERRHDHANATTRG